MNRRSLLTWAGRILGTIVAAVVAIPGVRYVWATVRRPKGAGPIVQRVARLADLQPNVPVQVSVIAKKRDAWTTFPEQTVGRAWLVRRDAEAGAKAKIDAYSTICPHLGCAISYSADNKHFICPCHTAIFAETGELKIGPSPRGMDALTTKLVEFEGEWWVELTYQSFLQGKSDKIATA